MMLSSEASLSPSVILARESAVAFLSLLVILASLARFLSPAGTIIGGRGLSESGSTKELNWISLGVPLKAGAGSLMFSGTWSSAPSKLCARRRFKSTKPTENGPQTERDGFQNIFIRITVSAAIFNQNYEPRQARFRGN